MVTMVVTCHVLCPRSEMPLYLLGYYNLAIRGMCCLHSHLGQCGVRSGLAMRSIHVDMHAQASAGSLPNFPQKFSMC